MAPAGVFFRDREPLPGPAADVRVQVLLTFRNHNGTVHWSFPFRRSRWHWRRWEQVLGTSLALGVRTRVAGAVERAESLVLDAAREFSSVFDRRDPQSEFSVWMSLDPGRPWTPSPAMREVLVLAEDGWRQTGGMFHPGIEAVSASWRQAASRGENPDPSLAGVVRERLARAPWTIREDGDVVREALPLSLDAVAKGWIVDRMADRGLSVDGVHGIVVNVGGDIRVIGDEPVVVGVALPGHDSDNTVPRERLRLIGAVATSGNQRRGAEVAGRWVGHVLDPRTGCPAQWSGIASVWAQSAAEADLWSTACLVAGPEVALGWFADRSDAGCCLIDDTGRRIASPGWENVVERHWK